MPLTHTLVGHCPGGWCDHIKAASELLVVLLLADCFIFLVTLLPPLFTWKDKRPDARSRVYFAAFACLTFYFWLGVLVLHSIYCFGFLAHAGPCANQTVVATTVAPEGRVANAPLPPKIMPAPVLPEAGWDPNQLMVNIEDPNSNIISTNNNEYNNEEEEQDDENSVLVEHFSEEEILAGNSNGSGGASGGSIAQRHVHLEEGDKEQQPCSGTSLADAQNLKNITLVNILIIVLLVIVIAANVNEVLSARSLYHCEALCKKEDVQRFLAGLTSKRPEVGHLVKCFHTAKSSTDKSNAVHKVVTYSMMENFHYHTWKDFSDLRLIEPSPSYPVIEVEVVLNFFPGDQHTAEKYKAFVQTLTKENSGKDVKISIDDYFHIEDQREWTFFIGNKKFIVPWWEKDPARIAVSCVLLMGWPFRLTYSGQVAKHRMEVKKAVFCETASQDEGVSLSATPGSSLDGGARLEAVADFQTNQQQSHDRDEETASLDSHKHNSRTQQQRPASAHNNNNGKTGGRQHRSPSLEDPEEEEDVPTPLPTKTATSSSNAESPLLVQHHNPPPQPQNHHYSDNGSGGNSNNFIYSYHNNNSNNSSLSPDRSTPLLNRTSTAAVTAQPPQQQTAGATTGFRPYQQYHNLRETALITGPATTTTNNSGKDIVSHHLQQHHNQRQHHPHHDINGLANAVVSTVSLKDIDVQMAALSGYETYV